MPDFLSFPHDERYRRIYKYSKALLGLVLMALNVLKKILDLF